MTIGVLYIDLLIPGSRSLKDRRRVMKSLKELLRNRFNCSVAEIGDTERWGRGRIVACVVSNDSRHVNQQLDAILKFASRKGGAEVVDYEIEML